MISSISKEEEKSINQVLTTLVHVPEFIHDLTNSINKPNWEKDKTINDPKMPFYALIAYQEKVITKNQFGILLLYYSVNEFYQDHNKISSSYFRINTADPKLVSIKSILDQINEEIKALPLSEQIAFVVPLDPKNDELRFLSIIAPYVNSLMLNSEIKEGHLKIPSWSILDILIKYQCHYPAALKLVIGSSTAEDIKRTGWVGERIVALHFPFVHLDLIADYNKARLFIFSIHDIYHWKMMSHVPPDDRVLLLEIGEVIENIVVKKEALLFNKLSFFPKNIIQHIKDYEQPGETIKKIADYFYDMDYKYYSPEDVPQIGLEERFWGTILLSFAHIDALNQSKDRLIEFSELPLLDLSSHKEIAFKIFDHLVKRKSPYIEYLKNNASFDEERKLEPTDNKDIVFNYACDLFNFWGEYNQLPRAILPDEVEKKISLPQEVTYIPTIYYKMMQFGDRISAFFDKSVTKSVDEILRNIQKTEFKLTRAGCVTGETSKDIVGALSFHAGLLQYNYKNPYRYLLLPIADLSAKTIGQMTYSMASLVKCMSLWRRPTKPSPKLDANKQIHARFQVNL